MYLTKDGSVPDLTGEFTRLQPGWSLSTQPQIDVYLLTEAKTDKINSMKQAWKDFLTPGFVYQTNTFKLSRYKDITNLSMKGELLTAAADSFKYDDINGVSVDFVDGSGLSTFRKTLLTEWDRCMRKKINYSKTINACVTIAEVEAITINFSA